ncbi:hypothetical protein, partial [Streptomyces sp. NPDC056165]|uniref:hypothetical protein n=1 Tax=Streptomyces sp. NPDC056165 TaxID=3345733 RepID=UPI0035DE9A7C
MRDCLAHANQPTTDHRSRAHLPHGDKTPVTQGSRIRAIHRRRTLGRHARPTRGSDDVGQDSRGPTTH